MPEVPSFYRGPKVLTLGLYFYYKDRFHLLIHKYYCKYVSIHTYLSHYILSVLFVPLLSVIVQKYAHCIVLCSLHTYCLYNTSCWRSQSGEPV